MTDGHCYPSQKQDVNSFIDLILVLLNYILDKHKSYLVTITIVINLK